MAYYDKEHRDKIDCFNDMWSKLDDIEELAKTYQIDMKQDELHDLALQWEIRNGGFSGRTAKQFIHMLLGKK